MSHELKEFLTEGQRLLCESSHSAAEIAKLLGCRRQRVHDWRTGRCRPTPSDRAKLKKAAGIPPRAWEAPPIVRAPSAAPPAAPPAKPTAPAVTASAPKADVSIPPLDVEALDLPSLGLEGLEQLATRLHKLEPTLPVRERVTCMQTQARVLQVHEALRMKAASARDEWLKSPEFVDEVRLLLAAVQGPAAALRERLASLGLALPDPTATAGVTARHPTRVEDVDKILGELETAKKIADAGELALAMAHVSALGIAEHADAIAALVLDDAPRTGRLLALLEGADERLMRLAIERAMAVRDARGLPAKVRRVVGELLEALGHSELATKIGGSHGDAVS